MTVPFPAPTPTSTSQPFWEAAARHELVFQRCRPCGEAVFPPREHCPGCWSPELDWQQSAGQGTVASQTAVHRPGHPAFAEMAPYTLVLIDLDEGYRMLSRMAHGAAAVGDRVRVVFAQQGETTLPLFEPNAGL